MEFLPIASRTAAAMQPTSERVGLEQRVTLAASQQGIQLGNPPSTDEQTALQTLLNAYYANPTLKPAAVLKLIHEIKRGPPEQASVFPTFASQNQLLAYCTSSKSTPEAFNAILKQAHIQLIGCQFFQDRLSNMTFFPDEDDNGGTELDPTGSKW